MGFVLRHIPVRLVELPAEEFEAVKKGSEDVQAIPVFYKVTTLGYRVWPLPIDTLYMAAVDDKGGRWTVDLDGWLKHDES